MQGKERMMGITVRQGKTRPHVDQHKERQGTLGSMGTIVWQGKSSEGKAMHHGGYGKTRQSKASHYWHHGYAR
ncbi:hypothetical protein P7K49_038435 [Saguinus oedipus]|uniref:Uncharacterized protein n=1 Tax=Saguinus oedipus TaxID=9490 RepID=A0ABQ9TEQ0_SAGOE|nr:hypothetical protein P7K49_038435 [Saguinus oedipus]